MIRNLHRAWQEQHGLPHAMEISFLNGCMLRLGFRAIALTLRAGLHSQPLVKKEFQMIADLLGPLFSKV
jgi:hypothetical protein